jgi:ABC-type branched-subunit amino acid transport system ATPase component
MMDIEFNGITPSPLAEFVTENSIWNSTFTFTQGNKYQIIAPSGKGKSTLVGIIAGTRGDFEGNLLFEGQNTHQFNPMRWSQWRAQECSIVFQDLQLFPKLTVLQNLLLMNEIQNTHSNNDSEYIQTNDTLLDWAKQLGIDSKMDVIVGNLSFGQMQRVAILRALNRPFKWIVLDEPFSHLDAENSKTALQLISSIAAKQNAGIIVTALDSRFSIEGFTPVNI